MHPYEVIREYAETDARLLTQMIEIVEEASRGASNPRNPFIGDHTIRPAPPGGGNLKWDSEKFVARDPRTMTWIVAHRWAIDDCEIEEAQARPKEVPALTRLLAAVVLAVTLKRNAA